MRTTILLTMACVLVACRYVPELDDDTDADPCEGVEVHCGDGVVGCGEDCDDGDAADVLHGDLCDARPFVGDCRWAEHYCGDGVLDDGEECDDGNWTGLDGCSWCRLDQM